MDGIYEDFINKLKKLYGRYDSEHKKFEKSSNSVISRALGYSDAQFSRLINESATEGEYQRAIQNIERILKLIQLEKQVKESKKDRTWKQNPYWIWSSIILLVVLILSYFFKGLDYTGLAENNPNYLKHDMLKWSFETSFVNPYIKLDDLPDDCNYPCYKYQGKWELKEPYKIPFFRERNGFHYLATDVHMYARCMIEKDEHGNVLEGFEYQKHEIWYDKRELPIDSFINVTNSNGLTDAYQKLDFAKDDNFVKTAIVHTFFRNELVIDSTEIVRYGKVIGRDLEFTPAEELLDLFDSKEMVEEIRNELNHIATNRLKDFSRPVSCNTSSLPDKDFHLIRDGDIMSFDCQLTTSRVPMNYNKTYVLTDQFIKNNCRPKN